MIDLLEKYVIVSDNRCLYVFFDQREMCKQ